jgi:colanic acid/amylovoran biosynthesis protein
MRILLLGQTTLHWGRMEFGNIGNYYIIEPFIRELHKTFPQAEIATTFQMSTRFLQEERIALLPMELYYGWNDNDLEIALGEFASAYLFNKTGSLSKVSPFIEEVMRSDLVIDFSGDIWGDNADFLGKDRFLIGLLKDRVAQLLGKKTAMIAGSPGPFNNLTTLAFAQEVFGSFDLVTNRESISVGLLKASGFDVSKVVSLACPAFLFEPKPISEIESVKAKVGLNKKDKLAFGFIICGWNFLEGPFDKWPRPDDDYIPFAEAVEFITEVIGARVFLMSHSNGFPVPPSPFKLIHGRDYHVAKQLEMILNHRGISKDFHVLENVLDAWQTKAIISQFDILVSGRIHGAVAGLSQNIPTVIIDYGHEPKAHKLRGFAIEAGVEDYVADPAVNNDIIRKIEMCWKNRLELQDGLKQQIPIVKAKARKNFSLLKELF